MIQEIQTPFPRTNKLMFPSRETSKTSAGLLSEKTHWFLTAYSCNWDEIAGNFIRFVPLNFLKDERQCQTLKTITSCLYKQPLVSLDINQRLGHLLSMPFGLASLLSPWLVWKATGSGMRHLVLQKQSSILPLVAFRIHLLYSWILCNFACFRSFLSIL